MRRRSPCRASTTPAKALALTGLASLLGCARMPPADVSGQSEAQRPEAFVEATPAGPCELEAFEACTEVCGTRECLDWCGGAGCVSVAANLYACAAPAAETFDAAHPEPSLEHLPPGPDAPEDAMLDIDPRSEDRLMDWELAREEALRDHWLTRCQAPCEAALVTSSAEDSDRVCAQAQLSVESWAEFAPEPEPEPELDERAVAMIAKNAGVLGALSNEGMLSSGLGIFGMLGAGGATLSVDHESLEDFDHGFALSRLITRGAPMADAEACVSDLDEDGESFDFTVEFDSHGRLSSAHSDSSSDESACLAELLHARLELPTPATRGLPAIRLTVHVHPYTDLDAFGGLGGVGMDGLTGVEMGEAYGAGGLGSGGMGVGGGGSGEGIGGLGTIGSGSGASGYGRGAGASGGAAGSAATSGSSPQDSSSADAGH